MEKWYKSNSLSFIGENGPNKESKGEEKKEQENTQLPNYQKDSIEGKLH